MSCDNLATKADIDRIGELLANILARLDSIEANLDQPWIELFGEDCDLTPVLSKIDNSTSTILNAIANIPECDLSNVATKQQADLIIADISSGFEGTNENIDGIYPIVNYIAGYFPLNIPEPDLSSVATKQQADIIIADISSGFQSTNENINGIYPIVNAIAGYFPLEIPELDLTNITAILSDLTELITNVEDNLTNLIRGDMPLSWQQTFDEYDPTNENQPWQSLQYSYEIPSLSDGLKQIFRETNFLKNKITNLYNAFGVKDYPIETPEDITFYPFDDNGNSRDVPLENQNSLIEFQSWQTRQIDAIMGAYPIKVTLKDSDLIKVGDQPLELEFPNIAELLAESMGVMLQTKALIEANLNANLRQLIEVGSIKKQAIVTGRLVEATRDYLGFKTKQTKEKVNFAFNPFMGTGTEEIEDEEGNTVQIEESQSISGALIAREIEILIEEEDEDKSLEEKLQILIEAARIIKGRFWRKLSPNNKGEWVNLMKNSLNALSTDEDNSENETNNFDNFLEKVEQGFISETGINNTSHPWGRI